MIAIANETPALVANETPEAAASETPEVSARANANRPLYV